MNAIVTMVIPRGGGTTRSAATLIERTPSSLRVVPHTAHPDGVAVVAPGTAVVVVVHGAGSEVLLATGVAPDAGDDHVVLRLVERRG